MEFLKEVVEEIKPNKDYEKEILGKIDFIINKINKILEKQSFSGRRKSKAFSSEIKDGKAILGGSGAKGTWLKTFDADIFVKFNYGKYKDKDKDLSDILGRLLKKIFKKITRLHGSRDYFQIKQGNFTFEIIPILDIKKAEQAKNITDVSPLHAKWVLGHKKLQDEIRLVKQFCKAQGVYGAESYIRGFSGYICEILTVYYGSFLNLAKKASKWKDKEIIDVEGYYKRKDVFRELNKSKLISPLIVIDPVQADRNAAAALSIKNFNKFKKACRDFLKNPSKKYFEKEEFSIKKIIKKNKNKKIVFLEVIPLQGKRDVVGCKLVKTLEFINNELIKNDFKVFSYGWDWDKKAIFYFVLDKKILDKNIEKIGPPLRAKEHVSVFKKKHKKTFIKGNRLFALDKRKFRNPENLMKSLFNKDYLKNKIKNIKVK